MLCCAVWATQFDEEPFAEAFGKKPVSTGPKPAVATPAVTSKTSKQLTAVRDYRPQYCSQQQQPFVLQEKDPSGFVQGVLVHLEVCNLQ